MINFSELKETNERTHLFMSMHETSELQWLLNKAGIPTSKCRIYPWRKVLDNEVPEIKDLSKDQRDAEILEYYGEDAKYIYHAPAVIISNFEITELKALLYDVLHGNMDKDYAAYESEKQKEVESDGIPNEHGILVMN